MFRHPRPVWTRPAWAAVLALLLILVGARPSLAARWQEIGNAGNSLDKVLIDLDSVQPADGGMRTVLIMTSYPQPRTNKANILMDRHVQLTAIDCSGHRYFGIQTVAYLGEKQVGHSPKDADWLAKMKLLPASDAMAQRLLGAACSAPVGGPGTVASGAAPGQSKVSTGSGIVVNTDGFVLTNAHVANGCKSLAVKVMGLHPAEATLEAVDVRNDLALIRTSLGYGAPAPFRVQNRPARLGEAIGVIGYPLTGLLSNEPKATFGQVNSVAGINNDYTLLQISAPIQPGNSGGPVLDEAGQVIGVIVSEVSHELLAKVGILPQNVNFAIRGEVAQIFMTAHGVAFATDGSHRRMHTEDIASVGEKSTAQIVCVKP